MSDRPPSTSEIDTRLVDALDEYLVALQAGRTPDKQRFLARYPDLASELESGLASLDFLRVAAVKQISPEIDISGASNSQTVLGDYRLVREIGRGGMGVVYEAQQISLGRRVALKVLPFAAMLDPKQLNRFKNEAHAAAQLHHTNIVPVFSVGCERGVHFYAMQYIEGRTLASVIRQLRQLRGIDQLEPTRPQGGSADSISTSRSQLAAITRHTAQTGHEATTSHTGTRVAGISTDGSTTSSAYFRTTANIGVQVADALEHAHQMGVIHRDIKPSNLLVDAQGRIWIADFGLAQFPTDSSLTMTGDLVGTLRYMSPEQASGQRSLVDHRADIYSLGITLYELITLEPAFAGNDRQQILRQIAIEEPCQPRRLNSRVPEELETIILKAAGKEMTERYVTAQEMADDLRRFLEDKPIQAKRPSFARRIAKWLRRHRAVASTAGVSGVVLLLTVAIGASIAAARLRIERNKLEVQRTAARQAEQLANHRLWQSKLEQARALRLTTQPGRRFKALATVTEAVQLVPSLNLEVTVHGSRGMI